MDITPFIRELLFGHDCVIVPGFGGFIGNHTPAKIDKNSGTFYPPVKQISFNRNLIHNDGLLVGRISESVKINYGDAKNIVEEFVLELRKKLSRGNKIVFDKIGSLHNNQEGNIQFEPDSESNYLLDSFGLTSFQCMPLDSYDIRERTIKHIAKDPARQASIRKILWRAAVIIPLLSILVAVSLKTDIFKTRIDTTSLNPLATAEFENNKEAVESGNVKEIPKEIKTNELKEESVSPIVSGSVKEEKINTTTQKEDIFYLITGSFKSEENATSQMKRLKEEGFTPEIVKAPNGFYRVSAMSFPDLGSAISKKDSIAKIFPGTWITRNR